MYICWAISHWLRSPSSSSSYYYYSYSCFRYSTISFTNLLHYISTVITSPAKYSLLGTDLLRLCQPIISCSFSKPNLYMYWMNTWKAGRMGGDLLQHYILAFMRVLLSLRQVRLRREPHSLTTFSISLAVAGCSSTKASVVNSNGSLLNVFRKAASSS